MIPLKDVQFKDIRLEYDHLFQVEPLRDEDRAYRWFAKKLLREKDLHGGILDVACGGGFFLRELGRLAGFKVPLTGIDLSGKALELAKRECSKAHLLQAVAEFLPFREGSFSTITCLGSLEHFLDIRLAIDEMKRVSRREGIFLILVPNLFWYKDLWSVLIREGRISRNQTHERFASLGEWKKLLEDFGLIIQKTLKYNGIAKNPLKQWLKDIVIPLRFSYHFLFICKQK